MNFDILDKNFIKKLPKSCIYALIMYSFELGMLYERFKNKNNGNN